MLEQLEQLDCALPLNVAIEAVADFIANTADMTDDERKTAAIVLRMVAQKIGSASKQETQPRILH